eukprot:142409_1
MSNVENTVKFYVGLVLILWTLFLSYPLFIYSWYVLNNHKTQEHFIQRGLSLIICETTIMFISICILIPTKVMMEDLQIIGYNSQLLSVFESIDICCMLTIFIIMTIKIWLVNYRHSLQLEIVNFSWKQRLDSFSVNPNSFYTKYSKTLGNLQWIIKYVSATYLLFCILFFLFEFVISPNDPLVIYLVLTLLFIACIVMISVLWCKYPKFKDIYFIRNELKTEILFSVIITIIGILFLAIINMSGLAGVSAFGPYVQVALFNGLCYIVVIRAVKIKNINDTMLSHINTIETNVTITLDDVLNNEFGYEEFMNFLVEGFAMENLCFATEYSQLRECLQIKERDTFIFRTVLSDKQSEFTIDKDKIKQKDFLEIIEKLYHKYISFNDAVYEINISYETRLALASIFDDRSTYTNLCTVKLPENDLDETVKIIIPIIEQILFEIVGLLQGSFTRFKMSDKWVHVCNSIRGADTTDDKNEMESDEDKIKTLQLVIKKSNTPGGYVNMEIE